jgi:hypothetical protein
VEIIAVCGGVHADTFKLFDMDTAGFGFFLLPASRRADSMNRNYNSFSETEVQSFPANDENFAITSLFARGETPGRVTETKFPY